MIIPIDREMKVELLKALKAGYLNTIKIPALYGEKWNLFLDLLIETSQVDESEGITGKETAQKKETV
jgi:hypothetical protein